MGGEQAGNVLATVSKDAKAKKGLPFSDADATKIIDPIVAQFEHEGSPYYASARLWDDGVIKPEDTRAVLGIGLRAALCNTPIPQSTFGVFRM